MRRPDLALASIVVVAVGCLARTTQGDTEPPLWQVYHRSLKNAKYVDLTHTITPSTPVWAGFGPSQFGPTVNPKTGKPYTYKADGFEATRYLLTTDQLGTQLDPPAHWNPDYPGIDELPATFAETSESRNVPAEPTEGSDDALESAPLDAGATTARTSTRPRREILVGSRMAVV